MRALAAVVTATVVLLAGNPVFATGETEQDIVDRYLKKAEAKHGRKISWLAANFTFNRINRDNDYNKFANYSSGHFSNWTMPWVGDGKAFGLEVGMLVSGRFAWSFSGEYWLKMGLKESGSFDYAPPGGTPMVLDGVVSQVQVWGVNSTVQYYVYNAPTREALLSRLAVRIGATAGYYQASWDLWDNYQNLNLATSIPEGANTTFKGFAPSFSFQVGADYPLRLVNMVMGVDFGYLYLNFANVSWYNASDEEIVATYTGSSDGRVDLNFSGFRGKVELKRFFKL
jgi:hypothetical protein